MEKILTQLKKRQKNAVKLPYLTKLLLMLNQKKNKNILKATENSKEANTNAQKDDNEGWKTIWKKIDSSLDLLINFMERQPF